MPSTFKNLLLCFATLLYGLSACSKGDERPPVTKLQSEQAERDFILKQVYSGQYCFGTRFYWRDSLRNVHDICQVRSQRWDSVNHVHVELHGWPGRHYCDKNRFIVLRQGSKKWFVPFCDETRLGEKTNTDTTFFQTDLVVTRPLNAALNGLVLRDRSLFLTTFLDALLPHRRLTHANYKTLLDAKTRAYLQPLLASPKRYFYRMVPSGLNENVIWEFDDTQVDGLHVRLIRPMWYKCFEL
ncbi:hypothetical protein HHL22_22205 [Hymenobacter sp. RP-2-7]|uniref:Lipoprotein n=1 Tax=Hymenobacter polaris TaxID=2682546 RepID=A0A7Y0AIE8_9BACT|nr:hypothetical protein [Hymenobacter polaris]NML67923.1 hypothetical protein [Hymenobacter polaris]